MDSEAGGAADLQTDVMRFMAILSLCLMVIFALVQSVPVETIPLPTPVPPREMKQIPIPAPVEPPPVEVALPEPVPQKPVPQKSIEPEPEPAPPAPAEIQVGFTLRFETDLALTQLVAKNQVGLFAITPAGAKRMTINGDKAEFWSASLPRQFHEMDTATVPVSVINAFQAISGGEISSTRWGVTLTPKMSGDLNSHMQEHRGGSLVIGSDGILRLEP